uniref:Uncharacterized protein n=1 Tax=Lepeophtheirus salmonis TaxID=72036 RepID=A0A0K2SYQ2_LEPSM
MNGAIHHIFNDEHLRYLCNNTKILPPGLIAATNCLWYHRIRDSTSTRISYTKSRDMEKTVRSFRLQSWYFRGRNFFVQGESSKFPSNKYLTTAWFCQIGFG